MSFEHRKNWERYGGKVPQSWDFSTVEDLLSSNKSISVGVMYPGQDTENGVPLVRVSDVKEGNVACSPTFKISSEVDYEYRRTKLNGTELLITLVGNPGDCVVVSKNMIGWNAARALAVLRLKDPDLRFWLRLILLSPPAKHFIEGRLNTTVQKTLNLKDIKELAIPIPHHYVRKPIEQSIYQLERKITLNTQINQTLEQMAQALFKSWFVDFDPVIDNALDAGNPIPEPLAERAARRQAMWAAGSEKAPTRLPAETRRLFPDRFEEDETLGWVPVGWESRKVLDLFELHRGFDLPTSKREHGSYPVFAAGGHHGTHSEFKMEPPGVITGRSGVIGRVYLSLEKYWPLNTSLYVRNYKVAGPYYAYHFLRRMDLGALNSGSAVPSLNRNYVHSSPALCPPVGLVVSFEKTVSCFFKKIALNNKQSENLSALRDTLLPKLLSGELQLLEADAAVQNALEVEPV